MTSFIQPNFSNQHAGVERVASAVGALRAMRGGFDSTKGLSAMLLAAMVSALVVVADQLIETWADGHLMVAWVVLWLVAFSALALFAGAARKVAATLVTALDAWSVRMAQRRADQRMWAMAKADPRLMADLNTAMGRIDL